MQKILKFLPLLLITVLLTGCENKVTVANVQNMNYKEAIDILSKDIKQIETVYTFSDAYDKDIVIKQSIEPDKKIDGNKDKIVLTISIGIQPYYVPDFAGKNIEFVQAFMNELKTKYSSFDYAVKYVDSPAEEGYVLSVLPNGYLDEYKTVIIYVSNGKNK